MSTFSIMILIYLKFYFRIKIINAVNDGLLLKQIMEKLRMNPKHFKYLNKRDATSTTFLQQITDD